MSEMRNVIIIGSGPSGYTAAIYLSRARLAPLLFSGTEIGGQLMYTTEVENFPGFPKGVEGPVLMNDMREQAKRFGTEIINKSVTKVEKVADGFVVWVGETSYATKTVLVTTGAQSRMLGLPNEKEVLGRGLSVCAVCDAAFYREKNVIVAGGGDSAMEDALALTKFADHVTVVHRRDQFRASQIMQERVLENPKVEVVWNNEISAVKTGDNGLVSGVELHDLQNDSRREMPVDGVFYAIGHIPTTSFVKDLVEVNEEGYIVTALSLDEKSIALAQKLAKANGGKVSLLTATSVPGIFAAGDCVDFRYRQAVTAAAYGTMGALDVERYLELL